MLICSERVGKSSEQADDVQREREVRWRSQGLKADSLLKFLESLLS
jgi:hypothetical protein